MRAVNWRAVTQWGSAAGLLTCALLALWGWRLGLLTSPEVMEEFVSRAGPMGLALFTLFQVVQVVVPVLPGGVSCLAAVVLFGPVKGFLCSYVGICIGSMAAFAAARRLGRPLLLRIFPEKAVQKYERWTDPASPFPRLFALAIFLPVAPDDLLCYLAGTTAMSWRRFAAIIWLCKPFSISLYSLGLAALWERVLPLLVRCA